jgi:tRNA pseudouridine38-40 synthase
VSSHILLVAKNAETAEHAESSSNKKNSAIAASPRDEEAETVPRFKLTIEYAGTRYSGWQIQKNARTVAGEIDRAARAVTGRKDFELYGSGRTDAGVHASGQVAHLDVVTSLPAATLASRLNEELPADINILTASPVPHRFHARHDAVARRYVYQLAARRTAFAKPYVWWVREPLDLERMRHAARAFVGTHDFSSFRARDEKAEEDSPLVRVERLDLLEDGALLLVVVQGSHFLWKMVRRLVGVLAAVGRGEIDAAAAGSFLHEASNAPARLTAPASGLFLERVFYKGDTLDAPVRAITPVN